MSSPSAPARVGLTGSAAAASLCELDWRCVKWQDELKGDLPTRPKQTGFRVFAILLYKPRTVNLPAKNNPLSNPHPYDNHNYIEGTNKEYAYVTGTNSEPCFIGSSICAERSAILQMRMKHYSRIESLYITADSDSIITPGLLCRELLLEFLELDTPVILASANAALPHGYDVQKTCLRDLFPYPPIFLNITGSELGQYAETFSTKHNIKQAFSQKYSNAADKKNWVQLYENAVATTKKDTRVSLHPLRFASGVLFSDGSMRTTPMTKLLEFGWSLDAIVKLVPYLEEKREEGVQPIVILLVDQFGNLHSPSAPARAHLSEFSYHPTLVFQTAAGDLVESDPQRLAPDVPDAIADVLPTTVRSSSVVKGE